MNSESAIDEIGSNSSSTSMDVSVLIPTCNENENIVALVEQLNEAFLGLGRTWELLFLDDSDDGTAETIRELQESNSHVSLLHRTRRQRSGGLGSAVVAGIGAARGQIMVIMDGDLQHPPQMVRELCTMVLSGSYEIAVASRYVAGASNAGLDGGKRRIMSRVSVALAHLLVPKTRGVRDPMSGFFAVSRQTLDGLQLRPHGFKILMEILARSSDVRVAEVPFELNPRAKGNSKAGVRESVRFLRHSGRLLRSRWSLIAFGRRFLAWLPLTAILAVQFALSYRLIFRNGAFVDEGTYLSAGHYELHVLLHGGPNLYLPTYFSGAPSIYPIVGALANNIGGLHGARFLSLGFMMLATVFCYGSARRLWDRPAGWLAAGLFVTTQGTQFLGAFATFDAMSLMLMALAAWIVVRFASSAKTSGLIYLAAPVLVFANATKYASGIFDPIIFLLALFTMLQYHDVRSALRKTAALLATFCLLLFALLAVAPMTYLSGISSTTTNRAASNYSVGMVLHDSWSWVGAIACVSLFAALVAALLAWRRRSGWAVAGIIGTFAIAVLLAPANQARIHTTISLNKHVTFGAWFGAVAAGWLVHGVTTLPWKRIWRIAVMVLASLLSIAALSSLLIIGTRQARQLDDDWPNPTKLITALRPLVTDLNRPVLMDGAPVAAYYLEKQLALPYWDNTWYFSYKVPRTKTELLGIPAYTAAVDHGYFSVIALNFSQNISVDNSVVGAIQATGLYDWVGEYQTIDAYGREEYTVWRLKALAK
jgi:glycosyltransferase involved in cell wall biosynthesis